MLGVYIHIPFCKKICNYCDFCKMYYDCGYVSKYLISIECKANCQYQIKRDYFKLVRNAFNKNKIEIPYNKLDVNVRGKNE